MEGAKVIYKWKSFSIGGYKEIDGTPLTFSTSSVNLEDLISHFEDKGIILDFLKQFSSFTIAKQSKNLIDNLIESYNLNVDSINLCALAAILQYDFSHHYDNPINTSKGEFDDIEFFHLELKLLFDLVEIRLNNESLENYEGVTFKIGNNRPEFVFNSPFIFKDLIDAFITAHNIDRDNFEKVKQHELSNIVNVKLDRFSEYHKQKHIVALGKYITLKQKPTNNDLRFIACFLLLSQIPISSTATELLIPSDSKDVSHSDLVTLRKYVTGEKDFSHKKLKR